MSTRAAITDPAVAQAFAAFPPPVRKRLLAVRALIHSVAAASDGVGDIQETLKWGEPAYLTPHSRSGSTIRLGLYRKGAPGACAVFFNCNTTLVDTFRSIFPQGLRFDGNRAIVLEPDDTPDQEALRACIGMALTYHRDKRVRTPR
jgi:hypothetical protein